MLMTCRYTMAGDPERALGYAEKALALTESRGDVGVARAYALGVTFLGRFALGDLHRAEDAVREGLRICRAIGDVWTGGQFLEGMARRQIAQLRRSREVRPARHVVKPD